MAAADVYAALNAAITGSDRRIDLRAAAGGSPALADLKPVLDLFGIRSAYVLTQANLAGDNTTVTLTASGSFGQPGAAAPNTYAIAATLTYTNSALFTLALRVVDSRPWTFPAFFPTLPGSMRSTSAPGQARGIRWTESFLAGSRPEYAVVVTSPSFTGRNGLDQQLQLQGFLPEFKDPDISGKLGLLSPWPLRLSGSIRMPAGTGDFPLMQLTAQGSAKALESGKRVDGVEGPTPFNLNALRLEISVERLAEPILGNDGISSLLLSGAFALGGGLSGVLSTAILTVGTTWRFSAQFDPDTSSLTQGLASLVRLFGVELPVPMDFPLLSEFHFAELDVELWNDADEGQLPAFSLRTFAITLTSNRPWVPPVPFVSFKDVGIRWVWGSTVIRNDRGEMENTYLLTGSVFGSIELGGKGGATRSPPPLLPPSALVPLHAAADGSVTIDVSLSIPSFYISGRMRDGDSIPIGQAFTRYFGGPGPALPSNMNVTALSFSADPIGQVYQAGAEILFGTPDDPKPEQAWTIMKVGTVGISIQRLELLIQAMGGRVGGGIAGVFFLNGAGAEAYTDPQLLLRAEYPLQGEDDPQGWLFAGHLYPGTSIDLTAMVARFVKGNPSYPVPDYVPHLLIDGLDATFAQGTKAYTFAGTASMRWTPEIFGPDVTVSASAAADIARADKEALATGTLAGTFAVNKIAVMASMDIGVAEPTYLLEMMFGELWVRATTAWRGAGKERHQVAAVQLGGVTLGDILEYLVNLAAPTLGFHLDPPWDLLERVELSRFVLTLDPRENVVELTFDARVNLGVMRVDTVGARYRGGTGQGKVELILTGNFFGETYDTARPLSWDVVDGNPPAVPGQGPSTVDLRFLGIGQRVTFSGPTPETVAASVARLRGAMKPPVPGHDPLTGSGLAWSNDSQWLIGLNVGLLDTVDLGFIFNDPKLYGLSVALGGERAGSLGGLRFEIRYKKITNDVGMYRIELRVPDAFRTLQLGAMSLTLGIAVIEIYTNGNFRIDLGFPHNRDYSRSFSLQAGIFIGRGGFYFGILDGDTSTSVPRITNGNFSPVIELGVGLAAGVGREVEGGILAGGAYVEIEVLFQGVLAWFNPTSSGAPPATYFRAQGVVAIHGKVYGRVNFAVVSVSITVEAFSQAMVVFESYQPILLEFSVGVRAEASVKILFIRVKFHFSIELHFSFTIGSSSPTPWILAGGGGTGGARSITGTRSTLWLSVPRHAHRHALMRQDYLARWRAKRLSLGLAADDGDYRLEWRPDRLVFDRRQTAPLTMLPYITVGGVPVDWAGGVPPNPDPAYRLAFLLYADTGIAVEAQTAGASAKRSAAHSASSSLPADLLVTALMRYALYALPHGPTSPQESVNAGQLLLLAEQLSLPETATTGFGMDALNAFFHTNLRFVVSGMPAGPMPAEKSAMLVPNPPGLAWTSPQAGHRDFSTYNMIGTGYEAEVARILAPYFPVGGSVGSGAPRAPDDPSRYESFATYLFRGFCQMLVKAAIDEAQKQLTDASVVVSGTMSLSAAAKTFATQRVPCVKEAGDTVQSVAARVGATAAELLFLDPAIEGTIATTPVGNPLRPLIGVSPEMLVQDNPGVTLRKAAWALGDVSRAVGTPETTLNQLATLFHVPKVENLFAYEPPPGSNAYTLGRNPNLLQEGRTFALPPQIFEPPPGNSFTLARAAALFFVRYAEPDLSRSSQPGSPDMAAWYAQAVAILNPGLAAATPEAADSAEIDPGTALAVPRAYGDRSVTGDYVTVAGDTLHRIASTLVLTQDSKLLTEPPPRWNDFRNAVKQAGKTFSMPGWPLPAQPGGIAIGAGETAESLARRLVVNASFSPAAGWSYNWAAISVWLGTAAVLSPLAVVVLPGASVSLTESFTFQTLADTYGLTLSDVAKRLQDRKGLLPDPTTLTVRYLPVLKVEQIEKGVLGSSSFAGVVNQASQMLMSGLRLPGLKELTGGTVIADPAHPQPLYDLSGQQFDLEVDTGDEHAGDAALTMTVTSSADWVTFARSFTVEAGHDVALLRARHPRLLTDNSRLKMPRGLRPGMVLLSSVGDETLEFSFTHQQILDQAPDTGLTIVTVPATPPRPTALPLKGTAPRTHGFEHPVTLQSAQVLPIPITGTPLAGYASLWPFPQGLTERAAREVPTPYEIFAGSQPGATADNARRLLSTTYGCQLSFRVRRMNDGSRHFHLLGVDTAQRGLLLSLRDEIASSPEGAGTKAWLAVDPAPNASNAQGLALLDRKVPCFLIRTNLSTDSRPEPTTSLAAAGKGSGSANYADFALDLAGFLLLLWEGSVVGGTGFYLGFGQDLPGSAFDGQGIATLTLLAIAGSQQDRAPQGRPLAVFNNCLLVGPGLDASIDSLYAEGADHSDLSEVSLTPPGNAGFTLTIDRPRGEDRQSALRDRYNTLVFRCDDTKSPYAIPASWTPALPVPSDGLPLQGWQRRRLARQEGAKASALAGDTSSPYWRYEQVIPFYRFTRAALPAASPSLPDPAADPYRGFGDAASCPSPTLTFCMSDLLGNHSRRPEAGQGAVKLKVGYTDPLIDLSQWPELAASFEVLGTPGKASLAMQIGLKAAASVPAPSQRGDAAAPAAQKQSDKYAQIYYQLTQKGVRASLSTTLRHKLPDPGQAIDVDPLWRFAAGAYVYATTAAQLESIASPGTPLHTLLETYPVRYAEMALANQDVPLTDLFKTGSQVAVPVFMPFIAQRSLADLYEQSPAGWPDPGSAGALFSLPANAGLPLSVGVPMTLPHAVTISTGSKAATPSLAHLAATNHVDSGLLAEQNAGAVILAGQNGARPGMPNVLTATLGEADGASLVVQVPVVPGQSDSFLRAQTAFAAQGVNLTVAQIAAENAGIDGLLAAKQTLSNRYYVTEAGDTPGHNSSGVGAQELGKVNAGTPGIFDDGALVQFGSKLLPLSSDTLNVVAQRYACPADLLLSSQATLGSGTRLAVPGCFTWPRDVQTRSGLRVPYTVRANDLLSDLCLRFASYDGTTGSATVNDCVAANAHVPGTLVEGMKIKLPGANVEITTGADASFASTLAQAQAVDPRTTMLELAASVAKLPGALQPGALLLFPVVRLPRACAPKAIASLYGVDSQSFALANAATPGLIAPGVPLRLPNPSAPNAHVEVNTRANDTFNSLIVRFSLQDVATDAGAIAVANPEAKLFPALALALLPPAAVREQVPLGSGGPYPHTVFPLTASLTLKRPAALIHPDFDPTGAVALVSSPLPARAQATALDTGSLDFGPFITTLTAAIPTLRVGTARVPDEISDLWCVDFSATGIAEVGLSPGVKYPKGTAMPRFLALRPLYDHLVTRSQLPIQSLNDDGTLSATKVPTNFQAIDAEPWALRFLSDLDRFLGGSMATALYEQSGLRATLTSAIESKSTIAGGIAGDLQGVFDASFRPSPDAHYEEGLETAREALRQQLYVSLLEAYDTSLVVQYDAMSRTPWTSKGVAPPTALYGQARLAHTGTAVNFAPTKTGFDPAHAFVTFFATVSDPARHRSVRGTLEYDYSHAEFDVSEENVPAGYQSSHWLSFIPLQDAAAKPAALKNTNPGSLLAPIPLRTFPSLPSIREQAASVSYPVPDVLARLPLWTYELTCTHEFAAQDSVYITADFNLSAAPQKLAASAVTDLFGALAQYTSVADKLWTLLEGLSDPAGNVTATCVNAAKTFAGLAATVAVNWHVRLAQAAGHAAGDVAYAAGKSFVFHARASYSDDGTIVESFSLTRKQKEPGPGGTWPRVEAILPDGLHVTLLPQTAAGDTTVYLAPAGSPIAAQDQQTFRLAWSKINVSAYQNARARMMAVRNDNLLYDPAEPDKFVPPTSPAFRLATGEVTAINIVTPLIERSVPREITGPSLEKALTDALNVLFPPSAVVADTTASWCAFYAYELVHDPGPQGRSLLSKLPVVFYPNQELNGAGAALAAATQTWMDRHHPTEAGAGWVAGLILYSALERSSKPLFTAELFYRLK